LGLKGARLKIFEERFKNALFPAWNIDHQYTKRRIDYVLNSDVSIDTSNKGRYTIRTEYKFGESSAVLLYILREDSRKLEISIVVNFKDPKYLVKYFIPLNLSSDNVKCEIPYGVIDRNRIPKTEMEKGKWEFAAQKWIDVSDDDYGVSILNDSRYGYSADKKGVTITLLRSPLYPSSLFYSHEEKFEKKQKPKFTDLMWHEFKFAIVPHKGNWKDANTPSLGLTFNNPVRFFSKETLPLIERIFSPIKKIEFEKLDKKSPWKSLKIPKIYSNIKNILVTSFKPSEWMIKDKDIESKSEFNGHTIHNFQIPENEDDWKWDRRTLIFRVCETHGEGTHETEIKMVNIPTHLKIERVEETDMLEMNPYKELYVKLIKNDDIRFNSYVVVSDFSPFEIKTIRVLFKN
jgi:alpha-mannosidase